jgi:hypothetical protein
VHRLQPGQEPLQEKNAKRRCLAAASFLWPAEITIVIRKRTKKVAPFRGQLVSEKRVLETLFPTEPEEIPLLF